MGDFSIQISSKLIKQLAEESDQPKRKAKRTKPKVSQRSKTDQAKTHAEKPTPKAETPVQPQPPFFFPIPQQAAAASVELESIKSVLKESEKVLEKLEKQEKNIAHEVTERAKYLRENEFKIPEPKPMPCSSDHDALMKCFRENIDDKLKCSGLVRIFENCARRFEKPVASEGK
uniref:Coiled-coil-helix-coiled-coil-helix domain-containing protein 3, mitochondrial n=1 Tax=Noccaea caerulescens TaxID=107243 RepID=A0A1J3CRQ4_NOCCA